MKFFIDFDGTITTTDVVDLVLARYGQPGWQEIEKEWVSGKIGSRECLARQMALVRMNEKDMADLLAEVQLDPFFTSFLSLTKRLGVPVSIVSDGFDHIIQEVLARQFGRSSELIGDVPVYSNHLRWTSAAPVAVFSEKTMCEHGCANCKVAVIDKIAGSAETVFIGDGYSDRFAARRADHVFAKGKLLDFCRAEGLRHIPYSNFKEVEEWLSLSAVKS